MKKRKIVPVVAVIGLLMGIWHFTKKPQVEADWVVGQDRVATFVTQEGRDDYTLINRRDFTFDASGPVETSWHSDGTVALNSVSDIWFFVEPLKEGSAFGHTFLTFVLGEGESAEYLSVSVEARRVEGESYSAIKGAFRQFELLYVWSSEKDILTKIGIERNDRLYAYKLEIPDTAKSAILDHFITRTNALAEKPRFYNSAHSNCTNELAKAVNTAVPGSLPWSINWITTAYAAHELSERGYIDSGGEDFEVIEERSDIRELIKAASALPPQDFSRSWRDALQ